MGVKEIFVWSECKRCQTRVQHKKPRPKGVIGWRCLVCGECHWYGKNTNYYNMPLTHVEFKDFQIKYLLEKIEDLESENKRLFNELCGVPDAFNGT